MYKVNYMIDKNVTKKYIIDKVYVYYIYVYIYTNKYNK